MAGFISTGSATSRNAPSAKKKRRRSSTNSKNPRRRSRKKTNPMLPCPSDKNPARRNPKRRNQREKSRKKNPSHRRTRFQAAGRGLPRRRLISEVLSESDFHFASTLSSPVPPDFLSLPFELQLCAIAAIRYLRADPRENFHARREHHRRRHAHHSRRKNRGGWRRLGHPRGGASDRRERTAGLPGNVRLDYPDGVAGDRRSQRHCRFCRVRSLQPGRRRGHGGVTLDRAHYPDTRGGDPESSERSCRLPHRVVHAAE